MIQAFVSSTYNDLKEHRAYVIDRLAGGGIFVDPMERWTAASDEPKTLSQERMRDCSLCILLVGFRRGHVPDGESLSITQLEYKEALRRGIDVLVFMASEEADWPAEAIANLANDPAIGRWRAELKEHQVASFFTPRPESIDVDRALLRWLQEKWPARQRPSTGEPQGDAVSIDIRAYSNSEGALIAWRTAQPIIGCLGFSLRRRVLGDAGITEDVVGSFVGFPGDNSAPVGKPTPSTIHPIQNFRWAQRLDPQQEVRYRVVPMIGRPGVLADAAGQTGSGWTGWVSPSRGSHPGCRAFFTRTHVTGLLARALGNRVGTEDATLRELGRRADVRRSLGGGLRETLLQLLTRARLAEQRVYAALGDLDDADLIAELKSLGSSLCLMLGALPVRPGSLADATAKLRRELRKAGVRVYQQSLRKNASARSHFAVFCDKWGAPISLWTGSAAWTTRALCLRSNSGILMESVALARAYLDLWDQLRDDRPPGQSRQPRKLSLPVHIRENGMSITLWDTPTPGSGDLRDVIRLVRGARQGIIFLVDGKRVADAVMGEILGLLRDKDLFIEGLSWFRRPGAKGSARYEYRVNDEVTVIEGRAPGRLIDGTIVLVDPFGPHPTVLTGSHDLSPETSARNQSDLLIIENAPQLAAEYAVYVIQLLDHYRWLSFLATRRAPALMGLAPTDAWQGRYFKGTKRSEFNFLFGSLSPSR